MKDNKYLIVVAGPTAVGKTDLCVNLAKKLDTVVVSADSRQFYKEMNIGTAKPTLDEMKGVTHYFVDNLFLFDEMNAGRFEKEALDLLNELYKEKDVVILTGGSGLYIKAICEGFDDLPSVDPKIRELLNQELMEKGIGFLGNELKKLDPDYYDQVDIKNPQRVIRALEIYHGTGVPFSFFRKDGPKKRDFKIFKIGLERPREELYQRIDARMDIMVLKGLFEEVEGLIPFKDLNALQTVGYKEVFDYLEGKYDKEEAIRLLKRNSRRYAKRQLTWFKKDNNFFWFHPDDGYKIEEYVYTNISKQEKG